MKKPGLIFILAALSILTSNCEEVAPLVNPITDPGNNNEPIPVEQQTRQVLIEEFTGVRCVNCPAGSQAIEDLLAIHGQRLVAISIHAGSFSAPYPNSLYDFRTIAGSNLLSYLGEPLGYPTAVVNRKLFDGEFALQLGRQKWAGAIATDLQAPPKVKLDIKRNYNPVSRQLDVIVSIYPQENLTMPDVRISAAITENNIADLQLTPDSGTPDPNYKHKHVLRMMLTSYDGNPINEALTNGSVITRQYSTVLPAAWRAEECAIVAFVNIGGTVREVLQAHQVKLLE
jgi:hypothetical protein